MGSKFSRPCIECGKSHDTGWEDKSGAIIERLDKCYDCIMNELFKQFSAHYNAEK
jgi:hypothetical protein